MEMKELWMYIWWAFNACFIIHLLLPLFLYVLRWFRREEIENIEVDDLARDYAIIVTAYRQADQLPAVVESILNLNYSNFLVYVVADNCDIDTLDFGSEKVVVLRPQEVLASNTKSHFYAIRNFRRPHDMLTIVDSDNLVEREYLNQLNVFFDKGYQAVQGVRKAKNLDTLYARLDEAGDIYYRYIDRKLLFEAGSSAALSGSGMAFYTRLYKDCLENRQVSGAGFDKVLQYRLLKRGNRIAFAERAVVYDEKTSRSPQLVKQRSRWINTWFRFVFLGVKLLAGAVIRADLNQFLFGLMLLRPPLFLLLGVASALLVANLFISQLLAFAWSFALMVFVGVFVTSLKYFRADRKIVTALWGAPRFILFQFFALWRARKANQISVATEHYHGGKSV